MTSTVIVTSSLAACLVVGMTMPSQAQVERAECPNAGSTVDIQNCQQRRQAAADAALNAAYRKKMATLSPARRTSLRDEERAWIRQRDERCAVKPDSGTSGSLAVGQCLLRETEARTQMLRS